MHLSLAKNSQESIEEMAKDLGFNEMDDEIVEMVSVVWKKIHSNQPKHLTDILNKKRVGYVSSRSKNCPVGS